jgi:hypothetical protein
MNLSDYSFNYENMRWTEPDHEAAVRIDG